MISNKHFINYKVLDLVDLYNFDTKFVLRLTSFKKIWFFCATTIPKDGWLSQPPLKIDF
jgi:hypothetical protein